MTSPPYYLLRKYLRDDAPGSRLELGREATPEEYVQNLVSVFRLVWRVLCDDGTLWLNLGDSYARRNCGSAGLKRGDLAGMPWRVALALQAEGWYLRSDIIWHKPNPKPEGGLTNRPTKSHEYMFLLAKQENYYYDIDKLREPVTSKGGGASFGKQLISSDGTGAQSRRLKSAAQRNHPLGKNKRTVWSIPVKSFHGAHFAVFPTALVRPCILAGSRPGGTVLDCFAGSGTTGVVAKELGRDAVLIDLNPVNVEMQKHRAAARKLLAPPPVLPEPISQPSSPAQPTPKISGGQGLLWGDL